MDALAPEARRERRQQEGVQRRDTVVDREQVADVVAGHVVGRRAGRRAAEVVEGDHRRAVDPEHEEAAPREELDHGQPAHHTGHRQEVGDQFADRVQRGRRRLRRRAARDRRREARELGRRVLAGREHGPQHRAEQRRGADVERHPHVVGQHAGRGVARDAERREQRRRRRGRQRAEADEDRLHRVAGGALLLGQHVADEGAKRLHRHVQRDVEQPERGHREPQVRRVRQQHQRGGAEERAGQEVRPPPPEAPPGAVAEIADHRLHQQAGHRARDPQDRQFVDRGAERLEDAADVGGLQRERDLDAEEAERQVADRGEPEARLAGGPGGRAEFGRGRRCTVHWIVLREIASRPSVVQYDRTRVSEAILPGARA